MPTKVPVKVRSVRKSNTPSMADVLKVLEKVFSGEQQYDEALEQLKLHVASVRKSYPALFEVMVSKIAKTEQITIGDVTRIVESTLLSVIDKIVPKSQPGNGVAPHTSVIATLQQPVAVEEQDDEGPEVILSDNGVVKHPYTVWVQDAPNTAIEGQEFYVQWDVNTIESFKVLKLGEPFTLKGVNHRTRFSVEEALEGDVYRVKAIAILPHVRG